MPIRGDGIHAIESRLETVERRNRLPPCPRSCLETDINRSRTKAQATFIRAYSCQFVVQFVPLRLSVEIRVNPWRKKRPWQHSSLRDFASSRESPQLQASPQGRRAVPRAAAGQISGWKARATFIRAHSCPFVPIRAHSCPFVVQIAPRRLSVKIRANPWRKKRPRHRTCLRKFACDKQPGRHPRTPVRGSPKRLLTTDHHHPSAATAATN